MFASVLLHFHFIFLLNAYINITASGKFQVSLWFLYNRSWDFNKSLMNDIKLIRVSSISEWRKLWPKNFAGFEFSCSQQKRGRNAGKVFYDSHIHWRRFLLALALENSWSEIMVFQGGFPCDLNAIWYEHARIELIHRKLVSNKPSGGPAYIWIKS